jgi:hypothetical protein
LSALIAWVNDDYGDKNISILFFQNFIPPEQIRVAERTRKLVKDKVGSYPELKVAAQNPGTSSQESSNPKSLTKRP